MGKKLLSKAQGDGKVWALRTRWGLSIGRDEHGFWAAYDNSRAWKWSR